MKRYIYLISPQKIRGVKFYKELSKVLRTKKVRYFQLRLKKISNANMINIICKEITNYQNKKFSKNEFFFDYLKETIKDKRKMGHLTILKD